MEPNQTTPFLNPGNTQPQPSVRAGFDLDWGLLTAKVWQAVADPDGQHVLPSLGWSVGQWCGEENVFGTAIAIWSSVLELLKYSFGWRSPAVAVARWVESGLSTDDRRLQVISHLIGADVEESAKNLAAFLYLQNGWQLTRFGHGGLVELYGRDESRHPHVAVPGWVRDEYRRRGCGDDHRVPVGESVDYLPCGSGGWDNMHLSGHCWAPIFRTALRQGAPIRGGTIVESEPSQFFSRIDGEFGRGVLVTHQYGGWFDELVAHGDTLPTLSSGRSWRVDVVCTPIGWLGTFRKSRQTGLWFSGPHSLHTWGELG